MGKKLFKARVAREGKGEIGGFRVCYYYNQEENWIALATIYSKAIREDISREEVLYILEQEGII